MSFRTPPSRRTRLDLRGLLWLALRVTNLGLLMAIAGGIGLLLGTYSGIAEVIPNARELGDIRPGQASRVLSAEGELLGQVSTEQREFVTLEKIPQALQDAMVATEDRSFYKHIGIDPRGIIRAGLHDIVVGGVRQGGSTITQQLARNIFLSQARTFTRKLAEVVLAVQLERTYSKSEIMELYLNQIYFGEGAYGVQVASRTYFGKEVSALTLPEGALLAGLPRRPEYYSPFEDEQRSIERRNRVLALMAEQRYLTSEQAELAKQTPLRLAKARKPLGFAGYKAPYFTNYVLHEVKLKYGAESLYRGGLTIHTTLNLDMQAAAEDAIKWGAQYAARRGWKVEQLALAAVSSQTGAIKAMVGGVDYKKSQYNRALQGGRQAGSAFKPFVYTAALEAGFTPESKVKDSPVTYRGAGGKPWTPKNYDGRYHGPVTFRRALSNSYNVAAIKVAEQIGITSVIDTAERMGIYHQMDPYLPLAIGSCDVSPLEMASAYAVFATRGMRTEPFGIAKIQDATGRTIYEHNAVTWRALNEGVAEDMVDMLGDVIKRGTAASIRHQLTFPAAGKTGTSSYYKDAWFVGFTNDLSCAVWAGNDTPKPMGRVAGSSLPAPVWARFMVKAQPIVLAAQEREETARVIKTEAEEEDARASLRPGERDKEPSRNAASQTDNRARLICPTSGLLAGPNCPNPIPVTYGRESGAEPPARTCDIHGEAGNATDSRTEEPPPKVEEEVTLPICAISNKIATPRCPLVVNRTFRLDDAPTQTCDQHTRAGGGL